MYLSRKDGSRGLSGECHLAITVSDLTSPLIPAADNSVCTYNKHSCSSSSRLKGFVDVSPKTGETVPT
ncbi:hypothetical protein Hanom_Chr04g00343131 [Helianthus anomalus]